MDGAVFLRLHFDCLVDEYTGTRFRATVETKGVVTFIFWLLLWVHSDTWPHDTLCAKQTCPKVNSSSSWVSVGSAARSALPACWFISLPELGCEEMTIRGTTPPPPRFLGALAARSAVQARGGWLSGRHRQRRTRLGQQGMSIFYRAPGIACDWPECERLSKQLRRNCRSRVGGVIAETTSARNTRGQNDHGPVGHDAHREDRCPSSRQ